MAKTPFDPNLWGAGQKGDYNHNYKRIDAYLRNEQPGEKVWSNPRNVQWEFQKHPDYPDHELTKVKIDDLLKNVDYSTLGNHRADWEVNGELNPRLFSYDSKKDTNLHHLINATQHNDGSYDINDGRHRLIALKNAGYTHAVIPVYDEFVNSNEFFKDFYQNIGEPLSIEKNKRNVQLNEGIKSGILKSDDVERFKKIIENKKRRQDEINKIINTEFYRR